MIFENFLINCQVFGECNSKTFSVKYDEWYLLHDGGNYERARIKSTAVQIIIYYKYTCSCNQNEAIFSIMKKINEWNEKNEWKMKTMMDSWIQQMNTHRLTWRSRISRIPLWKVRVKIFQHGTKSVNICLDFNKYPVYKWAESSVSETKDFAKQRFLFKINPNVSIQPWTPATSRSQWQPYQDYRVCLPSRLPLHCHFTWQMVI